MKVIIAPDKFKGSLSATKACEAIHKGLKDIFPEIQTVKLPLADGGNGTAQILAESSKGKMIVCKVHDPLFREIESNFGISGDGETAFVEMAAASGLELLTKEEQNCYFTSTFGTGELILGALKEGVKKIILCIGGSATNDGGIGMASALGYRFLDADNKSLYPIGRNLEFIRKIDDSKLNSRLERFKIEVACDVDNPLTGSSGATWIYGPQKGATFEQLQKLEYGLRELAKVIRLKYSIEIEDIPGAGAAGGLGGGAIIFLHATLKRGIEIVLEHLQFDEHLKSSHLVITGEGKLDQQSLHGKVIKGVLEKAFKYDVPVIALAGKIELSTKEIRDCGLQQAFCINPANTPIDESMANAYTNLRTATAKMISDILKSPQFPISENKI